MQVGLKIGIRCGLGIGTLVGLSRGHGEKLIIAIIGQSNAVGFADEDNLTTSSYASVYSSVLLKQQDGTNANPPVWTSYATAALQPRAHATLNMGCELSLGRYVDARRPRSWGLVKMGIGDTSLADYWRNGAAYPTDPPRLFAQMVTFLRAAEVEIGGRIAAFVWIQGERDATDATDAAAYEANLTQFIADVRAYWPALPFIFNRLHNSNPDAHKATIRAAQAAVAAAVSGTTMIDVDALALQGDSLHFTADGYVALGNLVGAAVLESLDINTLLASFTTETNGLDVTVTDTSSDDDGSLTAWSYDWGDGSAASTTQHPSHTYAADGTYTVTLTATDNTGGTDTYSAEVTVAAPTWTIDASSGKGTPSDATEWTALQTAHSLVLGAPDRLWLLQDASGNLAAAIGGKTLTVTGTPLYQQSETGWARKFISSNTGAAAANRNASNGTMIAATTSVLLLAYARIYQPVNAHQRMCYGTSSGNAFEAPAGSANIRYRTGGSAANGSTSHVGQVRPYALLHDTSGSGRMALFSNIEKVSPAYAARSETSVTFTFSATGDATINTAFGYAAAWEGAAVDGITDAQIKAVLQALGWAVTGW